MSFESIALLVDTYWMFLVGALALGVIVGWMAANKDANPSKSEG